MCKHKYGFTTVLKVLSYLKRYLHKCLFMLISFLTMYYMLALIYNIMIGHHVHTQSLVYCHKKTSKKRKMTILFVYYYSNLKILLNTQVLHFAIYSFASNVA